MSRAREERFDPTRTTGLRRQFLADVRRRFKRLKALIWEAIVTEDGFGLKTQARRFAFPRSDQKIDAFMDWLREQQDAEILSITRGRRLGGTERWSDVYIESAYQSGLARATGALDAAGLKPDPVDVAFFKPIHADRSALAFTRTFSELQGITAAMDQEISRALALGLAEGQSMTRIALDIQDRVDAIGLSRAERLARTETIRAHAEATLNTFADAGLDEVTAEVEFLTAGDDRVCPQCEALSGRIFSIDEARNIIPVHPNCRCAWAPVVRPPTAETGPDGKEYAILQGDVPGDFDAARQKFMDVIAKGTFGSRTHTRTPIVDQYVATSVDINDVLRGRLTAKRTDQILQGLAQRGLIEQPTRDALLKAMREKQKPLKSNVVVYRGVNPNSSMRLQDLLHFMKPGDVFDDKGFISTATSPDVAVGFTSESGRLPSVVFRIFVPKGTKVIRASDAETELVLDAGTRFKVLARRQVTRSNARIVGFDPRTFDPRRNLEVIDLEIVQ